MTTILVVFTAAIALFLGGYLFRRKFQYTVYETALFLFIGGVFTGIMALGDATDRRPTDLAFTLFAFFAAAYSAYRAGQNEPEPTGTGDGLSRARDPFYGVVLFLLLAIALGAEMLIGTTFRPVLMALCLLGVGVSAWQGRLLTSHPRTPPA